MSLEKALGYLEKAGYREHVIQLGESTATVAMAAEALGVEPGSRGHGYRDRRRGV